MLKPGETINMNRGRKNESLVVHPVQEEGGPKDSSPCPWQYQILCMFADAVEVHPGCVVQVKSITGTSRNTPWSLGSPGYLVSREGWYLDRVL